MSTVRKYAGLPDLDPAPDIYETPELTDDTSTHPTSAPYGSESPLYDQDDDEENNIDRRQIAPDEARTHFLTPAERDPKLASRISSKRKSYRSSSRKRKKDSSELNGLINGLELSSDNEEESLERKLARLRREVAEVKEEYAQIGNREVKIAQEPEHEGESLDALSQVLDSIAPSSAVRESGAAARLVKSLTSFSPLREPSANTTGTDSPLQNGGILKDNILYVPNSHKDNVLSNVSDFDSRLALLERALGLDAIPLPTQERPTVTAVLPSLDKLDRQITTLATSSESSLETISRRVRQLTLDAEKLEHARKAAKAAQEALRQEESSPSNSHLRPGLARGSSKVSDTEDPELISKINALYGTLYTIESLAPTLPIVLDRLRSLRSLHTDAATASQTLTKIESRQDEMKEELRAWREGLEKVEDALEQGENTMKANTQTIDGWVRDLEQRMQKLGQ